MSSRSWRAIALTCACIVAPSSLLAQNRSAKESTASPNPLSTLLSTLNVAIEDLTRQVSLSVVQVLVTGYGLIDTTERSDSGVVIGPQRSLGSGAIVDGDGYIITNAHVVAGAQTVRVVLHGPESDDGGGALTGGSGRTVEARVVGTARELDLALLKVDATGLRALPIADYNRIRQGELVFAFGSPEGLENSVTMGVVSAVARQPDPDSPNVYIQTDAPINPGNSGGPLVNVDGELVGLNTFILTQSGGSQGLGFAIPSAVVSAAYLELRKYGHLHRSIIGINVQAITPALAAGLGLSQMFGVVVADVLPGGPAEDAGVQVKDIIQFVDGKRIGTVPRFAVELESHKAGDTVILGILRESQALSLTIPVVEEPHAADRLTDLADPAKNAVPQLAIVGVDINERIVALLPGLRIPSGVLVAAREQESQGNAVPLVTGDVIHALNGFAVRSVDGLRAIMEGLKSNSSVVLQIERDGRLRFVTMRLN